MTRSLHIVSFDVPYPPNYGGVIDIYYKIKALYEQGIQINLHTFEYGRGKAKALEKYCKEVFYYPRNSFLKSYLSNDPFVVKSRANDRLISRLQQDELPILFEGLHTTYPLLVEAVAPERCFVRAHNIEHNYYLGLHDSEPHPFKKAFYKQEANKLKSYEKILHSCRAIFTIAPYEHQYFLEHYGAKACYIPAFHDHQVHTELNTPGSYLLYHGNVLVPENMRAALFLIDVYKNSSYSLIIASSYLNKSLLKEIEKHPNIQFSKIENPKDLWSLFENAHINVLPTFQKTGIKLKLLNTLYQGAFCLANRYMVEDTELAPLCVRADSKEDFLNQTEALFKKKFTQEERDFRFKTLEKLSPQLGASKIIEVVF